MLGAAAGIIAASKIDVGRGTLTIQAGGVTLWVFFTVFGAALLFLLLGWLLIMRAVRDSVNQTWVKKGLWDDEPV